MRRQAVHWRTKKSFFSNKEKKRANRKSSGRPRARMLIDARNEIRRDIDGVGVIGIHYGIPGTPSWRLSLPPSINGDDAALSKKTSRVFMRFMNRHKGGSIIYNTTVLTVPHVVSEKIDALCKQQTEEAMSEEDRILNDFDRLSFAKERLPNGMSISTLHIEDSPVLKSLGNRSIHGYRASLLIQMAHPSSVACCQFGRRNGFRIRVPI